MKKPEVSHPGVVMPEVRCPHCHTSTARAAAIGNQNPTQRPRPGDASCCLQCGALLEFTDNGQLQPITEQTKATMTRKQLAQMTVASALIERRNRIDAERLRSQEP